MAGNTLALCMLLLLLLRLLQAVPDKVNHTFSMGKQHKRSARSLLHELCDVF